MDLRYMLFTALLCQVAVVVWSAANPNANERTQKLLAALGRVGDRMLSGAFGGYNKIGFSQDEANRIQEVTNKLPAIYGIDCRYWDDKPEDRATDLVNCFNSEAVDYYKKGGIITLSHHIPSPASIANKTVNDFKITNKVYASILTEGTPDRNRWLKLMDKVAEGLLAYKQQGVPILYRPFHEMTGDWFWWGNVYDPSLTEERKRLFKKLWQDLFNFMKNKGLDNLLWVYSPGSSKSPTDFYPGDNFVDIVALDCYPDSPTTYMDGYDSMVSLGKPFAFAEVGSLKQDFNFDYNVFINTLLSRYPKTVYFMTWNEKHSPAVNKNAKKAYNNPKIINLGELNLN